MNKKVLMIGAGGQAKVAVEILEQLSIDLIGYISSEPKGSIINGYQVLCSIDEFIENRITYDSDGLLVSIGDNYFRGIIHEKTQFLGLEYLNLIHPSAIISSDIDLGVGIYIGAGAIINPGVKIGNFSHIGVNTVIGHDCLIGESVNIAPSSSIAGNVVLEKYSVIGIGSTVIEHTKIGSHSILSAGSVLLRDIQPDVIAMGNPAKIIQYRNKNKSYFKEHKS